jgi:DNA-directed RNA polymerase I subunit RPA1
MLFLLHDGISPTNLRTKGPKSVVCDVLLCLLQELYGDEIGGAMLNALSRLFTSRLQAIGFTCGMDDLLLTPTAEAGRSQVCVC